MDGDDNAQGFIDCIVIPDCDEGELRPADGTPDETTGLIPCEGCDPGYYRPTPEADCEELPPCDEGLYRPNPNDECEAMPDCEEGLYRPDKSVLECDEMPACPEGEHRSSTGEVDADTGLIPCAPCPEGEVWNGDGEVCESACAEDETWNTETSECEAANNECLLETYFYDETCVTSEDDECMWYSCSADKNGCDCDGARACEDDWCKGTAGAGRDGTHYPYDPAGSFAYDPAVDEEYEDHYIDDMSGYPYMIDPATGLVWGIDPDTGEMYDGLEWPQEDDEPVDPAYATDFSIFGENPATPGFYYG